MTACVLLAAVISCTNIAPRPSPAEAVRVLTASVQPYVAPPPQAAPQASRTTYDPHWPFAGPMVIPPKDQPWSVTTYNGRQYFGGYGRAFPQVSVNGPFSSAIGKKPKS